MGFIDEIKARAKADKKVIVLPETEDERTYKAAQTVLRAVADQYVCILDRPHICRSWLKGMAVHPRRNHHGQINSIPGDLSGEIIIRKQRGHHI